MTSEVIDPSEKIEEELLPYYKRQDYYPMRIGDIVNKYQIIAKLGYGATSTVWLSRGLWYSFTSSPHLLSCIQAD
jgi:hypothetical protein